MDLYYSHKYGINFSILLPTLLKILNADSRRPPPSIAGHRCRLSCGRPRTSRAIGAASPRPPQPAEALPSLPALSGSSGGTCGTGRSEGRGKREGPAEDPRARAGRSFLSSPSAQYEESRRCRNNRDIRKNNYLQSEELDTKYLEIS